jgi:hypothetical protein
MLLPDSAICENAKGFCNLDVSIGRHLAGRMSFKSSGVVSWKHTYDIATSEAGPLDIDTHGNESSIVNEHGPVSGPQESNHVPAISRLSMREFTSVVQNLYLPKNQK